MAGGKKFSTCDLPAACSAPTFASEIRQERAQQMASFICVFCKMLAGLPAWGRSCSGCELQKSWFTFSNPTATVATPLRSVEKCEKFALRMLPTAKETYNARTNWVRSQGGLVGGWRGVVTALAMIEWTRAVRVFVGFYPWQSLIAGEQNLTSSFNRRCSENKRGASS